MKDYEQLYKKLLVARESEIKLVRKQFSELINPQQTENPGITGEELDKQIKDISRDRDQNLKNIQQLKLQEQNNKFNKSKIEDLKLKMKKIEAEIIELNNKEKEIEYDGDENLDDLRDTLTFQINNRDTNAVRIIAGRLTNSKS